MGYIENPKTKGSGIICAIPQDCECPVKCDECFFQSGRSYLEPLDKNLPNIPPVESVRGRVVRINDGNDSNVQRDKAVECGSKFEHVFYNTSLIKDIAGFPGPVVLTINPGKMTDSSFHRLNPVPANLMFVRFRANLWNMPIASEAYDYYSFRNIPVVFTFMAYHNAESILKQYEPYYDYKKRTLNEYYALNEEGWYYFIDTVSNGEGVSKFFRTCGVSHDVHACRYCGNCLREYFATSESMKQNEETDDETKPRW